MEGAVGVKDAAADVALAIEDLQTAGGAVGGDADHDAAINLAGGDGPVGVGVRRELVVTLAARREAEGGKGDDEAAKGLGSKKLGNETSILQREQLQT